MTGSDESRLLPGVPFPPYAFVPGQFPHPENDPAGHSFGQPRPTASPAEEGKWRSNATYLRGLDLFNAGYYWESHVEFESLWLASGRRGPVATFMKGLIKLAAAGVKHRENRPQGVKGHAAAAIGHWRDVLATLDPDQPHFLGFRLGELIELAAQIERDGWPAASLVLWPEGQD